MLLPSLSITFVEHDYKASISTEGEGSTKLLALVVDLLDTLLEDWYPAIGTRFVHSSEGDLLVNRFVPCSKCACEITTEVQRASDSAAIFPRKTSSECAVRGSKTTGDIATLYVIHSFSIEECMLSGREYGWLECPSHGGMHMRILAPDTVRGGDFVSAFIYCTNSGDVRKDEAASNSFRPCYRCWSVSNYSFERS
ncbi:unnamed protein product [Nippostrongylus brasiliensis]|uniref:Uncharacterized protein n=1 Tax=Nippostrongylus brasiliensis TaxID=27835 RepID=A0A0N4XM99_NIPBR|nr:unnamed protein product [Nippostrongylus brasiliensis]